MVEITVFSAKDLSRFENGGLWELFLHCSLSGRLLWANFKKKINQEPGLSDCSSGSFLSPLPGMKVKKVLKFAYWPEFLLLLDLEPPRQYSLGSSPTLLITRNTKLQVWTQWGLSLSPFDVCVTCFKKLLILKEVVTQILRSYMSA